VRRGRGKQGNRQPGKQVSIGCLPGYLAAGIHDVQSADFNQLP